MKLFISISIGLIFVFFKTIEIKGGLDSIIFRILGLRQLPEINITFIGTIIKKLLLFPDIIYQQIKNYIEISELKYIQHIIIFIFYSFFTYATMLISSRFYGKDATIVKFILATILLVIVYFI